MEAHTDKNIAHLQDLMKSEALDAFYVSGFDIYLNEYTPREEGHRYPLTGFTGSTGETLATMDKVHLYVDGRYHEQARLQCDPDLIRVVECPMGKHITNAMREDISSLGIRRLGVESGRLSLSIFRSLEKLCSVQPFAEGFLGYLDGRQKPTPGNIHFIDPTFTGRSHESKIEEVLTQRQALFTAQLDSLSWILNLRGFQIPFQGTVKAKALISRKKVSLFVPEDSAVEDEVRRDFHIVRCTQEDYEEKIAQELGEMPQEELLFDPLHTNAFDALTIEKYFRAKVTEYAGLVALQSIKNPVEVTSFETSFDKADQAIFQSLCWLKEQAPTGRVSEVDYRNKTEENYRLMGAKSQSFPTISGFAANSAFIHYGSPKEDFFLGEGDTALLDSGGIFEEGFATDCTRTILGYGEASPKHKLIYTLVLIGVLRVHRQAFKPGTLGKEIDAVARQAIKEHGFEYDHGTGHGVGINVHEGGFNLSPKSEIPLVKGKIGSVEPGIYLPDFGGVRLENVAVVEDDPNGLGLLRLRNLVFIGFDHSLIDFELLGNEQKGWLFEYERQCLEKGRSFLKAIDHV